MLGGPGSSPSPSRSPGLLGLAMSPLGPDGSQAAQDVADTGHEAAASLYGPESCAPEDDQPMPF